jgi:holliday junction DNA helicase RuvA
VIALLRGTLVEKNPSRLIVEAGGVGYDVQVPLSTFYELGEPGTPVTLRIHTHVREDAIALFGFATPLELNLFERLIGINGIGPKLALAVLSGIEPPDFIRAIRSQDVARLTAIPGIGKKTAERMVLELREKMRELAAGLPEEAAAAAVPADQDVVSALVNLGYKASLAERAVAEVRREKPDAAFNDLLRASLNRLSRA